MASENAVGDTLLAAGEDARALGAAFLETTGKVGKVLSSGRKQAAGFQAIIRDIALTAKNANPGAWTDDSEQKIGAGIELAARDAGVSRDALASSVGRMVSDGVDVAQAVKLAPLLAQFAVGQKAGADDSAALMATLNQDFDVQPGEMAAALARIASFGKAEKIERGELVKVLPVLLRDLKNLGFSGEAALVQAQAILKQRMVIDGDPAAAGKFLHESLNKLRGKGSEADLEKARAATRAYSGNRDDRYATAEADVAALESDRKARSETSAAKWGRAGQAVEGAGLKVGEAMRPATDFAADQLTRAANGAASLAEKMPLLTATLTAAAGAYALYGSGKIIGQTVGKALGISGGKDKEGGSGQKVQVTNWPTGLGGGGGGLPELPGGGNSRTRWGRVRAGARWIGAAAARAGRVAWGGRHVLAGALNSPVARVVASRAGLLAAGYTALDLAASLSGNKQAEKDRARHAAYTTLAGGALGLVLGGPAGAMLGLSVGRMAYDYFGNRKERNDGKTGAATAAAAAAAPAVHGGQPFARAPATAQSSAPLSLGSADKPRLTHPDATARFPEPLPNAPQYAPPYAPPYAPGAMVTALGAPVLTVAAAASVAGAAGMTAGKTFAHPAAMSAARSAAGAAAVAKAAAKAEGTPEKAQPGDAAREGALQAAVNAASAPAARTPSVTAAAPQPAQINFNPAITVTVQGDVREPRRIAEELMPYLRQLFDQFQGQQQRSMLHDSFMTTGGYAV